MDPKTGKKAKKAESKKAQKAAAPKREEAKTSNPKKR